MCGSAELKTVVNLSSLKALNGAVVRGGLFFTLRCSDIFTRPLVDMFTLHLSVLEVLHIAIQVENLLVLALAPAVRFNLPLVKLHTGSNLNNCVSGGNG